MSRSATTAQFQNKKSKTLGDKYLIGDEIGKGAYGRVYMGLDSENGDFVAIKEVSLENILPEDLASIMQEIDLLKNLNHKNIVKYLGSLKTKSHLYIILEYVENGSLASIIKPNKFGAFPESLVAVYISQVLEGLVYLHEQGVIHRDIKGANILATKEGLVKLADFGVATKLTEADANTDSVVGTPYWMAPEVIVMSGVSAASDIWSVGCTVIELLTCVPPYYDLQPMTALFRIVEEDQPPIPEHISPLLSDFLHQCFRKDAKLRPDAKTLLQHPWILNSRKASFVSVLGRNNGINDYKEEPITNETREIDNYHPFGDRMRTTHMQRVNEGNKQTLGAHQSRERITNGQEVHGKLKDTEESFFQEELGLWSEGKCGILNEARISSSLAAKSSAQELMEFTCLMSEHNMDDLFEQSSKSILTAKCVEGPRLDAINTNATFSSCTSDNEQNSLTFESKAKTGQKKLVQQKVTSAYSTEKDMFSVLMHSNEVNVRAQSAEINKLMSLLKPEESEDSVIKACQKLVCVLAEQPHRKSQIVLQYGIMPFIDMLEMKNARVLYAVMQVVNQLAKDDPKFQENACLVGLVPVVMSFAGPEHSKEMRLQAATFVQQLCQTSSANLQMFIACRGLPILVGFLESDYAKYREMVHIAIDGMWKVFKLHNVVSKNDLCHILSKNGVLIRLVNTLHSLNEATRLSAAVKSNAGTILGNAAHCSRSGPIQPSRALSGRIEAFHPHSGQLDALRLRGSSVTRNGNSILSYGHTELSRPFPNLFEHMRADHDWSSSVQQEQPLLFRVDRQNFDLGPLESSFLDINQRTPFVGSDDKLNHRVDQPWYSASMESSQQLQQQQEAVQPLISLHEIDPPLRFTSGQLQYTRHQQGGLDKHNIISPLFHHASRSRRNYCEQGRLMSAFEENAEGDEEAITSLNLTRSGSQARGFATVDDNFSGPMGVISQSASGPLAVSGVLNGKPPSAASSGVLNAKLSSEASSGVLNGKPFSAESSGVLSQMVSTLNADAAKEYLEKVASLLLEFSHGDTLVKSYMCSLSLLIRLFHMLNKLEPSILLKILECIKELSADPHMLEHLQRADAMKHLVPFLDWREGPLVSQIQNEVMVALYNLCKVYKRRQERAAESGIIPRLMHFAKVKSHLKQFALPLLCDMAHASRYTREQVWANKGIEFYLDLLDDEGWAVTALDSVAACLALDNDQRNVEQTLLKAEASHKLVAFFRSCDEQTFVHILEPFLKIIIKSPRITVSLTSMGLIPLLVERLDHKDAIARVNLLKLIKVIYDNHPRPKQLIVEYDLQQKLQRLIEQGRDGHHVGGQVLVKQMATSLLKALHIDCVH